MNLAQRIQTKLPVLDERQRRLFLASEARKCRQGGVKRVSKLSGVSEKTIRRGLRELAEGASKKQERARRPGGGRKPIEGKGMASLVSRMMEGEILSYTLLGRTAIVREIESKYECKVSVAAVERAFQNLCYKKSPASDFPNVYRRAPSVVARQLAFIDSTARVFQQSGDPVIFVDGQSRILSRQASEPHGGNSIDLSEARIGYVQRKLRHLMPNHVFSPRKVQQKISYVKSSRDTGCHPGPLIESIAEWWEVVGDHFFPNAHKIFVICNFPRYQGERDQLWKYHLLQIAVARGIEIHVSFLPCGRYRWRWTQEGHRLYHVVSCGDNEVVATAMVTTVIPLKTSNRGLAKKCCVTSNIMWLYKLSPHVFDTVDFRKQRFCGELNYSVYGFKKKIVSAIARAQKEEGQTCDSSQYEAVRIVEQTARKMGIQEDLEVIFNEDGQRSLQILRKSIQILSISVRKSMNYIFQLLESEDARKSIDR